MLICPRLVAHQSGSSFKKPSKDKERFPPPYCEAISWRRRRRNGDKASRIWELTQRILKYEPYDVSPHDADENDDVSHTSKVQARLPGTSLGVIGVGLDWRCALEGTRESSLALLNWWKERSCAPTKCLNLFSSSLTSFSRTDAFLY